MTQPTHHQTPDLAPATPLSRRAALRMGALAGGAALATELAPRALHAHGLHTSSLVEHARPYVVRSEDVATPEAALRELMAGNERFVAGKIMAPHRNVERMKEVLVQQKPFAAFLGCADSRVPIEIVFDQGFGDIFPVRLAGNVVTPEITASLEFGTVVLGAKVLFVLGHSGCGAVSATIKGGSVPGQISTLYQRIAPAVDAVGNDLDLAIAANVRIQLRLLRRSPVIGQLAHDGKLRLVGGVYEMASGRVRIVEANA